MDVRADVVQRFFNNVYDSKKASVILTDLEAYIFQSGLKGYILLMACSRRIIPFSSCAFGSWV